MKELGQVMYQKMYGKDGCNFGEVKSILRSQKLIRKIIVAAMKPLLELTQATLFQLENIAGNLLLKKFEIQHQVQASITPSGNLSIVTPIVPPATNVDKVDPSISSDDCIP
ncbi:hypothetical protein KY284_012733 [Solanum tuberosum]|nr:hypothetical protein KY284_012733 [Solanum tuberosum]